MRATDRFGPFELAMRKVRADWLRLMRATGVLRGLDYLLRRPRLVALLLVAWLVVVGVGLWNQAALDRAAGGRYKASLCAPRIDQTTPDGGLAAEAGPRPTPLLPQFLTHYCVVRADLPIGVQAAQLIHAAGSSSPGNLPDGTYAVALTVKDERELRLLAETLERSGLPRHLIIESDAPYSGQAMAIGIPPMDRKKLKPFLSKYALLKGVSI